MTKTFMAATIIGTLACGCAETAGGLTPQPARGDRLMNELETSPEWVKEDCREKMSRPGLCAVGVVAGIWNPALARETAEMRGQVGISRQLESVLDEMGKDFQDSVAVDESTQGLQHRYTTKEHRSSIRLVGARVTKWHASKSGTLYALVVLEKDGISASLSRVTEITPAMREEVMKRSERAFEELRQRASVR